MLEPYLIIYYSFLIEPNVNPSRGARRDIRNIFRRNRNKVAPAPPTAEHAKPTEVTTVKPAPSAVPASPVKAIEVKAAETVEPSKSTTKAGESSKTDETALV